jgi:hypothetical protein
MLLIPVALGPAPRRQGPAGQVQDRDVPRSRDFRPRWNFWSRGPFVMVWGGHCRCEHFGKLAESQRICGAPVQLCEKVFSVKIFGASVTDWPVYPHCQQPCLLRGKEGKFVSSAAWATGARHLGTSVEAMA